MNDHCTKKKKKSHYIILRFIFHLVIFIIEIYNPNHFRQYVSSLKKYIERKNTFTAIHIFETTTIFFLLQSMEFSYGSDQKRRTGRNVAHLSVESVTLIHKNNKVAEERQTKTNLYI